MRTVSMGKWEAKTEVISNTSLSEESLRVAPSRFSVQRKNFLHSTSFGTSRSDGGVAADVAESLVLVTFMVFYSSS